MNLNVVKQIVEKVVSVENGKLEYVGKEILVVSYTKGKTEILMPLNIDNLNQETVKPIFTGSIDEAISIVKLHDKYLENKEAGKAFFAPRNDRDMIRLDFVLRKVPFTTELVDEVVDEIDCGLVMGEAIEEVILSHKLKAL